MIASEHHFLRSARESPGPRDWILSLYGSFIREFGGWIAVADLLTLLASLGVRPASGRAALSRMKQRGEIQAAPQGSTRGYTLTEATDLWFEDGTDRIMGAPSQAADELWAIASFTIPEQNRQIRYKIRSRLRDLGFGRLSGGLMIAPAHILDETIRAMEMAGLRDYVDFWQSRHRGPGATEEVVGHAWNLPEIREAFDKYLDFADQLQSMDEPDTDEDAFVRYLINISTWRELPFMDPGIPQRFLPEDWPAATARATFHAIASKLRPAATVHFVHTATVATTTPPPGAPRN